MFAILFFFFRFSSKEVKGRERGKEMKRISTRRDGEVAGGICGEKETERRAAF